jgi:hypothetical protein
MARTKAIRLSLAVLVFSLLCQEHLHAGDWKHMVQACGHARDELRGKDAEGNPVKATGAEKRAAVEDCGIKFYGLEPIGLQIGSIAPQGNIGLGLQFKRAIMHSQPDPHGKKSKESDFAARGLYSFTNFYLMEGRYDFKMAALGQGNSTTATFDDQIDLAVFASRLNLAKQRFYGIGENTSQFGLAEYRHLEDQLGASADWPILAWFSGGGTFQWVRPSILGPSNTSVPSVVVTYGDSGAPGALSQPSFMNYKAYLDVHTGSNTTQTWQRTKVRGTYEHFTDLNSDNYTFDRMSGFATTSFDLRKGIASMTLPWWQSAFCAPISGGECSVGQLTFNGLVTASYVGSRRSVPFYFQPTLGGTDINGVDTLRGLNDFRLRAPNRVLLQAQFDHPVWWFFGISGFYDVGKVALNPGDLSLSGLRHDLGIGAYIKVQNKVVLRAYLGFGGGEGLHPNAKFPSALWGSWATIPMATFP